MRHLLYKTGDALLHHEIGKQLKALPEGEYVITIKKNKNIRSLPANAFFHAVCQIYAIHTGHYLDEIKDEFKRDRFYEMTTDKQGKEFKRLKETSKLDTQEFAAVCNNLLQWGREKFPEVIIPRKEDMTYIQWMEVENQYNRTFSGW